MKIFSDQKIFRYLFRLIQPDVMALGLVSLLYALIFWSTNKGVSIDEGYYLLGYLKDQPIGPKISDFHRIVRTFLFFVPGENALMYRWIRIILTILFLYIFSHISYRWLKTQYDISLNKLLYYSMSFLAGTMCFSYASPVIYYDNLQLIIYLIVFSLLLYGQVIKPDFLKLLVNLLIGIILVLGVTNYPSSGALLIVIVFTIRGIYLYPSLIKIAKAWIIIFLGFGLGILLYSLLIHNFFEFFREAAWTFVNAAKSPKAKYDTNGQRLVIIKYFVGMMTVYLPVLGMVLFYLCLAFKKQLNRIILNIVFILGLVYITYRYSNYFANILLLPIILLVSDTLVNSLFGRKKIKITPNTILAMLLLLLPFMAVVGSNQRLEMKMVYFMPFWFLALFVLYGEFKTFTDKSKFQLINYVFIIVFIIVFSTQGFLKHIHYNYSIKRSRHLIENADRFTNIGVSEYQKNFYENGIRELKKAGFEPGDNVLTFWETFMLVYAAGGYVPHRLTYSAEFFVGDKSNIPPEKAKLIIIDEGKIPMLTEFLSVTNWAFPESYSMVELGTDGHNLTQLGYNYILFFSKE